MAHAKYSPSSLELLELCPCYQQDESGDKSASEAGTRLHKAVEKRDLSLCENEEEEQAVQTCLNYLDAEVEDFGKKAEVFQELLVEVEDITEGTADVVIVNGSDHAALIDWKFGRNPVTDADANPQMQGYALGVFAKFPRIRYVEVHIVCPRQDTVSTSTYERSDCDRIRKRIHDIIASCECDAPVPHANEKGCRYCGAKAECPALGETALTVAKGLGLPLPIEFEPGRMIRPEDRSKAQVLSYILEDWAKKVRVMNSQAVIEDGIEIPGFELKSKRGTTTVVDVLRAQHEIEVQFGIQVGSFLQACKVSLPKLIDQVYAQAQTKAEKVTKKGVREDVLSVLKEYVSEADTVTFLQRKKGKTNEDIIEECT